MNLSWQNGSQLHIVSQPSGNSSYYYDASGARYQKISKGVTTTYHLVDGVAYGEKRSNGIELQYLYDENGSVYGIRKNGILYFFLFNGQGDVIGIYDEYKTLQARYEYDAWGKLLSVTNASGATITSSTHIGNINPFRYRGYYYDVETGFYYLNSRYYDPEVKRFLTADDPEILFEDQDNILQYNLFAYCLNNPVNMHDPDGYAAANIIGGIVGGATGAALGVLLAKQLGLTGWKKWALISAATAGGAVLGAFLGPYVAKLGGKVAAKLGIKTATKAAFKSIGKITAQKMSHINVPKHLWGRVLKKVTNKGIENLIQQAVKKGVWETLKGGVSKITYSYGGEIITVTGKIINGVFKVGDAWVNR